MTQSKSVCPAPFIHTDVGINGNVSVCCHTHGEMSFKGSENLMSTWRGVEYENIRERFARGDYLKSCSDACLEVENSGGVSLRQRLLKSFNEQQIAKKEIKYLALRWNRICNLKCRYCDSNYSSGWDQDSRKLGLQVPEFNQVHNNDFITEDILKKVEAFYFSGGEPLLSDEHLQFINKLVANNLTDKTLIYNTNLTLLNRGEVNFIELWRKFKRVEVHASIDDFSSRFDYIRSGSQWPNVCKNILEIRDSKVVVLTFFITISIFNCYKICQFIKEILSLGFLPSQIEFNYLHAPEFYDARIYPHQVKEKVKLDVSELLQHVYLDSDQHWKLAFLLKGLLAYLNSDNKAHCIKEFYKHTEKIDQIRGEDFSKTFPELHVELSRELI